MTTVDTNSIKQAGAALLTRAFGEVRGARLAHVLDMIKDARQPNIVKVALGHGAQIFNGKAVKLKADLAETQAALKEAQRLLEEARLAALKREQEAQNEQENFEIIGPDRYNVIKPLLDALKDMPVQDGKGFVFSRSARTWGSLSRGIPPRKTLAFEIMYQDIAGPTPETNDYRKGDIAAPGIKIEFSSADKEIRITRYDWLQTPYKTPEHVEFPVQTMFGFKRSLAKWIQNAVPERLNDLPAFAPRKSIFENLRHF